MRPTGQKPARPPRPHHWTPLRQHGYYPPLEPRPNQVFCPGMNLLLLVIVLLLLFGGGGFYFGGPVVGGSTLGLVLLIVVIVYLVGGFRK